MPPRSFHRSFLPSFSLIRSASVSIRRLPPWPAPSRDRSRSSYPPGPFSSFSSTKMLKPPLALTPLPSPFPAPAPAPAPARCWPRPPRPRRPPPCCPPAARWFLLAPPSVRPARAPLPPPPPPPPPPAAAAPQSTPRPGWCC